MFLTCENPPRMTPSQVTGSTTLLLVSPLPTRAVCLWYSFATGHAVGIYIGSERDSRNSLGQSWKQTQGYMLQAQNPEIVGF